MSRARICHVASVCRWLPTPDNPSAGVFVLRRLEAMADRTGVTVVQPIPYFPLLRSTPAWAELASRPIGRLAAQHAPMFYVPKLFKALDGYWLYRAIVGRLRSLHAERPIDLIDAHFGYPDGVGSWLAARRLGIPFFLTFRGLEADYPNQPLIRTQISRALRDAAGCICVSGYLRDLAIGYGADPGKVCVIHNAVDKSLFSPGERAGARRRLGLTEGRPLIVSVGHLLPVKGHHALIGAFASLRNRLPEATLAIIGAPAHDGAYHRELVRLTERLGLDDSVKFVGGVAPAEVATWLHAADLFALATRREGCCNAILEALAAGVPVVTTPVGDNACFVQNERNGFIVPVADEEALAAALERALRRNWDARAISAGLAAADWGGVAARVLEFFESRGHGPSFQQAPGRSTPAPS